MHAVVFWERNGCLNVNELLQCMYRIYLKQDDSNLKMNPKENMFIKVVYIYISKSKMTPNKLNAYLLYTFYY